MRQQLLSKLCREDSEPRDPLVDPLHGSAPGPVAEHGLADLAGLRSQAAPAGPFQTLDRPVLVDKLHDVVGLYLNPPEAAVVLCVDEKTQVQALDRTQPVFPMLPGTPERASHDYVRHGTSSLYAALDVASGQVIGSLHARHRAEEFLKFLRTIDEQVPDHLDLHLVLDNVSTHKTPAVQRWLNRRLRFHLHFTPTSSSWLNLVEWWFAELTAKKLQRSTHRSVRALNADIRVWIETWNDYPRPYVWVKTAEQILESLGDYCQRIIDSRH